MVHRIWFLLFSMLDYSFRSSGKLIMPFSRNFAHMSPQFSPLPLVLSWDRRRCVRDLLVIVVLTAHSTLVRKPHAASCIVARSVREAHARGHRVWRKVPERISFPALCAVQGLTAPCVCGWIWRAHTPISFARRRDIATSWHCDIEQKVLQQEIKTVRWKQKIYKARFWRPVRTFSNCNGLFERNIETETEKLL